MELGDVRNPDEEMLFQVRVPGFAKTERRLESGSVRDRKWLWEARQRTGPRYHSSVSLIFTSTLEPCTAIIAQAKFWPRLG